MEEIEAFQSSPSLKKQPRVKLLEAFTFVCNALYVKVFSVHSKHCRNPFGNTQHVILYVGVKQVEVPSGVLGI